MAIYIENTYYCLIFNLVLIFATLCDGTQTYTNVSHHNVWTRPNATFLNDSSWPAVGQPVIQTAPRWVQDGSIWVRATTPSTLKVVSSPGFHGYDTGTRRGGSQTTFDFGSQTAHGSGGNQARDVQDDELRDFSESLLSQDTNNAAGFVNVNFQGKTTSRSQTDEAPAPLLQINSEVYRIVTVNKLMQLYNNYVLLTSTSEQSTPQERQEEDDLLDALLDTSVMENVRQFLISHGKIGNRPNDFKEVLRRIWFEMYPRGGREVGSSGFEHVFLAEIKKGVVSGLHNWLYFQEEEKRHNADYLGYLKKIDLGNKGAILKHHFKFHNLDKPVGSMFIGTSPELEMGLYTTCFLLRPNRVCPLRLAGHNFVIRTYVLRYQQKEYIGSAFPEI